ncbi:hypothetical protein RJ639_014029 [Escallonia herrerae]|uniref:Uncharacterized protein n=1 Tax=Escallonia herrerae TaxID=1293975 RepID=A0AA88VHB1_9ASTE|nr:hypothetical protein RJ639_014029 [Escallonia herrerae]
MHRSSSSIRVSDDFYRPNTAPAPDDGLPTYNPQSFVAKRERSRLRSAEAALHIIPLLLVLCAIVLWFFSNTVVMVNKGDSFVVRIEGLRTHGNIGSGSRQ